MGWDGPVVWLIDEGHAAAVGQVLFRGDRVVMTGVAKGMQPSWCDFHLSAVERVVVSHRVNPMLHVRLRDRGWLRVIGFSTNLVYELAQTLSHSSS